MYIYQTLDVFNVKQDQAHKYSCVSIKIQLCFNVQFQKYAKGQIKPIELKRRKMLGRNLDGCV